MQDPAALARLANAAGAGPSGGQGRSDIGACFQLALLAAAQNNDQEAGGYLRQVIAAMKAMVSAGGSDAGSSPPG